MPRPSTPDALKSSLFVFPLSVYLLLYLSLSRFLILSFFFSSLSLSFFSLIVFNFIIRFFASLPLPVFLCQFYFLSVYVFPFVCLSVCLPIPPHPLSLSLPASFDAGPPDLC